MILLPSIDTKQNLHAVVNNQTKSMRESIKIDIELVVSLLDDLGSLQNEDATPGVWQPLLHLSVAY